MAATSSFFLTRLITRLTAASKIQLVFFVTLVVLFPPLVPFLKALDSIVQMRREGNQQYPWPEYSDLKVALYVAVAVYLLWGLLRKPLLIAMERRILPKYVGEDREDRAHRAAGNIFKGTYYLFIVLFGYFAAWNAPFLPATLGGHGSMDAVFDHFPYQPFDSFPLIRTYLMVQLGFHLFSFVEHMMSKPKNNFMEMLLHHCMTLLLISLAYFMNYVTVSHLVLFLHDISDLFLDWARATADTHLQALTRTMSVGVVLSWLYTRLYLFPVYLIDAAYWHTSIPDEEIYGKHLLGSMLHVLLVLHIYWFILIVKMAFRLTIAKKEIDIGERFDAKKTA
jgi:ceramide synthetase